MSDHWGLKIATVLLLAWSAGGVAGEPSELEVADPPATVEFARPLREGIPSLQLTTDFVSPALGLGTYRPTGQVESRGFRVAPFTVRAVAHTGVGYNDNVALTQANRISSMVFTLAPSVAVGLEGALARYYVMYRGNYGRYSESSVDNYEEHDVVLSAANSWSTRLRSLVMYEYLKGHNPRGATLSASTVSERWVLQSLRASGSYGADGAQGRIEADAAFNRLRYSDNRQVTSTRDYDAVEVGGTFLYRVAPRTRALVQLRRADINHEADRTLDNSETRFLLGLSWEALATLEGTVRVGYMTKDFSEAVREDFSGPSYEAALAWFPQTYSSVELAARRVFGEAYEAGSSFVVSNVGTLTWNHQWPKAWRSTLGYTFGELRHEGLSRTDTYQDAGLKISYGLRRWLRAGAEYRHDTRKSSSASLEYRRNLTFITLEAAL